VGLIARGLEINGIATTLISWKAGIIRAIKPPRALITSTNRGETMGPPHDNIRQRTILITALKLLEKNVTDEPLIWDEKQK